jgi:hypothetical protein
LPQELLKENMTSILNSMFSMQSAQKWTATISFKKINIDPFRQKLYEVLMVILQLTVEISYA